MILVILGPTASGKSAVAFELAKIIGGEIVNADSKQIYRFVSQGTAQPNSESLQQVTHHLYNFLEPNQTFNAGEYSRLARAKIQEIISRKKKVIIAGGTGLYIKALFEGLSQVPPKDENLRAELMVFAEEKGKIAVHNRLKEVDPVSADKIPYQNIQRSLRALEVYLLTQKPIGYFHSLKKEKNAALEARFFGLRWPGEELKQRVRKRAQNILPKIIEETKILLSKGCRLSDPVFQSLGYQNAALFLEGKLSEKDYLNQYYLDTVHYAKRQMTWFKRDSKILWIEMREPFRPRQTAEEMIRYML